MGVEACYAKLVGGVVDGGRIAVYRGFGRKCYRARRGVGKSVVAFSDGWGGVCGADDVCSGRETVCGDCGGVVALCIRTTLKNTGMVAQPAEVSVRTASLRVFPAGAKQSQAQGYDPLHRIDNGGQEFVGDDLAGVAGKSRFQTAAPGNPQFRIDVHNRDASSDGVAQVAVIGSRSAMQGEENLGSFFDLADARDVQALPVFSLHHVPGHSVPVTDGWSEGINLCFFDELLRFLGSSELAGRGRIGIMNLRARAA